LLGHPLRKGGARRLGAAFGGVAAIVISVAAAALSFELIERPALSMARKYFAVKRLVLERPVAAS
jgi:peptidoglycan/LPS O-acetylase OafA/YrhL